MREACEIEISVELAIDACEQIEVELCRYAGRVVVGGVQHGRVLDQIDPDDQERTHPQHLTRMPQECRRLVRLKVTDG